MPDQHVLDRIDGWRAAGLIDEATAARLRIAEASEVDEAAEAAPRHTLTAGASSVLPGAIGSMFGPAPSIAELFAYLGAGFLIVAWHVLVAGLFQPVYAATPQDGTGGVNIPVDVQPSIDYLHVALEWALPAIAFAAAGWLLLRADERARRAAGVAFAVATFHVFGGLTMAFQGASDYLLTPLIAACGAAIVAVLFRVLHGALLTQAALLVSLAGVATTALAWLASMFFPGDEFGSPSTTTGSQLAALVWWLAWAVGFGLLARWEAARRARHASAGAAAAATRRVLLTRFAAGLTAVVGTAVALLITRSFDSEGIPTVVADLGVLLVSGVLIVLAARAASVYLYPAALGIIIALTSLNATYVVEQTSVGVAFFVEGVILLAGGLFADRLRRRLTGYGAGAPASRLIPDDLAASDDEQATITEITPA